jgi:hypothetical protein
VLYQRLSNTGDNYQRVGCAYDSSLLLTAAVCGIHKVVDVHADRRIENRDTVRRYIINGQSIIQEYAEAYKLACLRNTCCVLILRILSSVSTTVDTVSNAMCCTVSHNDKCLTVGTSKVPVE